MEPGTLECTPAPSTPAATNRTAPSISGHGGDQENPTTPKNHNQENEEIDEDDLCPICHLLLFEPVTTTCNHSLCSTCMSHWARTSQTTQMTILAPSSSPSILSSPSDTRCPMCRTLTTSSTNPSLGAELRAKYPRAYEARAEEERSWLEDEDVEMLTLCIGNEHRLVDPEPGEHRQNMHEWTFFVRPSRTDVISEVQILLHPTFRPNLVFRKEPPYSIRRLGWGYFTITAYVVLKPGWSWVSEDAEVVPFRRDTAKARLPLDWELDFNGFEGRGSMGRCRFGIKREQEERGDADGEWQVEWVDDDEEEEGE